jgi:enoyl-CoA hydratase/carnithine racemase
LSEQDIRFERVGCVGLVTLDRPKALHALTHDMVRRLSLQLVEWRTDNAVRLVVIKSSGGRAFCAGGDVAQVVRLCQNEGADAAIRFFHDEYRLNWRIKHYPKPYIALIDGIVMGGGFGVSAHGHFRILGYNTMMAMPETAIGFFPDVGGTHVLSRMENSLGMYLGLTGARLHGEQAVRSGFGSHLIDGARHDELLDRFTRLPGEDPVFREVAMVLDDYGGRLGDGPVLDHDADIARLFDGESYAEIRAALERDGGEFARQQLDVLARMSPLSLEVTVQQLVRGEILDFDECLQLEFQMVRHFLAKSDFAEGVRAMIIDKDRKPQWGKTGLAAGEIDEFFVPSQPPLEFDWKGRE